mmetsp:Transcript_65712/g.122934  ORF Transcript_65712/g.122934 Transcript_65712/m.122934 type:complete len:160 (+) Transcript_65712:398-877(+)
MTAPQPRKWKLENKAKSPMTIPQMVVEIEKWKGSKAPSRETASRQAAAETLVRCRVENEDKIGIPRALPARAVGLAQAVAQAAARPLLRTSADSTERADTRFVAAPLTSAAAEDDAPISEVGHAASAAVVEGALVSGAHIDLGACAAYVSGVFVSSQED